MAQPPPYVRGPNVYNAAADADAPLPWNLVEGEFNEVKETLDATLDNLELIQRDDGLLRNASVHPDALSSATRLLIAGWEIRGDWTTLTDYAVKDFVESGGIGYVCLETHFSGTFATDLIAGKWLQVDVNSAALAASSGSSLVGFAQSGSGAVAETVEDALQRLVFLGQYATTANFNAARAALTGTLGISPNVQFANVDPTSLVPAGLIYGGATFNGTYDPVIYLGYNISGATANTRVDTSEPLLKLAIEGKYNDGAATYMEFNLNYLSSDGLTTKRSLAHDINRSTHVAKWGFAGNSFKFWKTDVESGPQFAIDLTNLTSTEVIVIRAAGGSNESFQFGPTTAGVLTNFRFGFGAASGSGGCIDTTATQSILVVGATNIVTAISTGATVTGTLTPSGAFGCNTKTAQSAFASGGALNAYGAGANGLDSGANMSALHAMVVAIRAALVADGIMS